MPGEGQLLNFISHGVMFRLAAYCALFFLLFFFEKIVPNIPQTRFSMKRLASNLSFTGLNILVAMALGGSGPRFSEHTKLSGVVILISITQFAFTLFAFNLITWVSHFLMHRIPFLWKIHRVHHFDSYMDISTTARFHPLENIPGLPLTLLFIFIFRITPIMIMSCVTADMLWNLFIHANIRLPDTWSRRLEMVLVTPQYHRLHHSTNFLQQHRNYSATFTIWDRIFGTYRCPAEVASTGEIGVVGIKDARTNSFFWLLMSPFHE